MSDVYVYIYDLSKGLARSMSLPLLGRQIEGVWHTGIVAYGAEWYFGSGGISSCPPCGTILGQPDEKKFQGRTQVSYDDFMSHISNLSRTTFKHSDYHLLSHNCNNFSDHISDFLTGKKIPSHITGLPQEVLQTPFGQMLLPMLEQMSVNPGANNPVNFNQTAHSSSSSSSSSSTTLNNVNAFSPARREADGADDSTGKFVEISEEKIEAATKTLRQDMKHDDERKPLLDEIKEFCLLPSSQSVDWSLGRPHLYLLSHFLSTSSSSSSSSVQIAACDLLAAILNREEMVAMTTRDPKRTLQSLVASSFAATANGNAGGGGGGGGDIAIRVFANLTRHSKEKCWFLSTEVKPPPKKAPSEAAATTEVAPYSTLTKMLERMMTRALSDEHSTHFAVLFYNTCLGLREMSKSSAHADFVSGAALEMVTPILEFFVQLQSEETDAVTSLASAVETLIEAVETLVVVSEESKQLSKCYGIDVKQLGKWSDKTKLMAAKVFG